MAGQYGSPTGGVVSPAEGPVRDALPWSPAVTGTTPDAVMSTTESVNILWVSFALFKIQDSRSLTLNMLKAF